MTKKEYNFDEYHFDSQKDLDLVVKDRLRTSPLNVEFVDKFLISVINNFHDGVKKHKQTCVKLKILDYNNQPENIKEQYRGNIFVTGYFTPYNKWHGVTVYSYRPKKSDKGIAKEILRLKYSKIAPKRNFAVCEVCHNSFAVHAHHDNISFNQIAEECIPLFSAEDLVSDWWQHESAADKIDNEHPAVLKMITMHSQVVYKWLCPEHHHDKHTTKEVISNAKNICCTCGKWASEGNMDQYGECIECKYNEKDGLYK